MPLLCTLLQLSISISIVGLQFGVQEELDITRAGFSMPCYGNSTGGFL